MVTIGPISSIFDITTFLVLWHVIGADSDAHQALFQSGWFVEGLLSQTLIVHMIRTRKIPFLQSRASWPVMVMTALAVLTGLWLPFSPLAAGIGLTALPLSYFPWLLATLLAYCGLAQLIKSRYIRRFDAWL
jgi:Mg2+-importing ATPase